MLLLLPAAVLSLERTEKICFEDTRPLQKGKAVHHTSNGGEGEEKNRGGPENSAGEMPARRTAPPGQWHLAF